MSTKSLARKLKKFLEHHEEHPEDHPQLLSASDLRKLNRKYQQQYNCVNHLEAVNKFMKNLSRHLESRLSSDGYLNNPNTPQELLTNLARLGTFGLTIYQGYLPDSSRSQITEAIQDYLVDLFQLANFKGMELQLTSDQISLTTTVRMSWGSRHQSNHPRSNQDSKTRSTNNCPPIPFEINYPAIYNPDCPQVSEQIRSDLEQNLKELRSDLKRNARKHQKHRHRTNRAASSKTTQPKRSPPARTVYGPIPPSSPVFEFNQEFPPLDESSEEEYHPTRRPRVKLVSDRFHWDQETPPFDALTVDTESEDHLIDEEEEVDMS